MSVYFILRASEIKAFIHTTLAFTYEHIDGKYTNIICKTQHSTPHSTLNLVFSFANFRNNIAA